MTAHASHTWGPHHAGLRWVECSACTVLLHEPEAEAACPGDSTLVDAGRASRRAERARAFVRIARSEAGWLPPPSSRAIGMWQT
jgi:hypothetical protein